MAASVPYIGKKRRKMNLELETMLEESKSAVECEKSELVISFRNGEDSFVVGEALNIYTFGNSDYDEQLIGSPDYWHQIIVS